MEVEPCSGNDFYCVTIDEKRQLPPGKDPSFEVFLTHSPPAQAFSVDLQEFTVVCEGS